MAIIKIPTQSKHRGGCGENRAFLCCWWDCEQVPPLRRVVWGSLQNQNRASMWPSNSTMEHAYRENHDSKRYTLPRVPCSTIYNSQNREQPKLPPTEARIKMWCIHTVEDRSVIKESEIMPSATTWMGLEVIIQPRGHHTFPFGEGKIS